MPRHKLRSIKAIRRELDSTFSAYIRRRDANAQGMGRCITCGQWRKLEAGHFIPRQYTAVRWNPGNVHGQCSWCNRWQHGNQAEYYLALVEKCGQPTVDELMRLKRTTVKMTRADYEALLEKYSERVG